MLKEEFESRIGKRVTMDTFREYEKMYLAIDADKDTFCKMLNLDAIPEDPAAVKARAEAAEKIAEARADVQRWKASSANISESTNKKQTDRPNENAPAFRDGRKKTYNERIL